MTTPVTVGERSRRPATTVEPGDSLRTVVQVLCGDEIGVVIAVDAGRPVGVISERDVVRSVMLHDELGLDGEVLDTVAGEVMSAPVIAVPAGMTVHEAGALMQAEQIRHLVVEAGDTVHVVSLRDLPR